MSIAYFVSNFVAMATGVTYGRIFISFTARSR